MKTHYKISGTSNSPVLVFSNSLGADLTMWDGLVPKLLPYFRVLQYDTRGHGKSEVTEASYSVAMLGQDVIDLLDDLKIKEVYFCGLSMGGLIGQWLATQHPNRVKKLVLSNTNAKIGDEERWNSRIALVKQQGMGSISAAAMDRWFTEAFLHTNPTAVSAMKSVFEHTSVLGYTNCCAAIRDADFRDDLSKIEQETLILTGDEDDVTTAADAAYLASKITGSETVILKARHLTATEHPDTFAELLIDFLVGSNTFDRGMHVRKTVLGEEHVARANTGINDFNKDFQVFISHYAWGEIWTRPGLPKHDRSLITLAMLIALNRKAEFKMHVKAAINNDVSVSKIKEVIMQAGIYCGLPAANEALHSAQEVFQKLNIKY